MERYIEYSIELQGQKAVDVGYALQGNHCYKVITDWNGRFMGQLEVVLDDKNVVYNGFTSQWVAISFLHREDIERMLSYLRKAGFVGCPCIIIQENRYDVRPDGKPDDGELCCFIL